MKMHWTLASVLSMLLPVARFFGFKYVLVPAHSIDFKGPIKRVWLLGWWCREKTVIRKSEPIYSEVVMTTRTIPLVRSEL